MHKCFKVRIIDCVFFMDAKKNVEKSVFFLRTFK